MNKILNHTFKTANHRRKKIKDTTTTTTKKRKREIIISRVTKIQLAANDTSHTGSVAALEGMSRAAWSREVASFRGERYLQICWCHLLKKLHFQPARRRNQANLCSLTWISIPTDNSKTCYLCRHYPEPVPFTGCHEHLVRKRVQKSARPTARAYKLGEVERVHLTDGRRLRALSQSSLLSLHS